MEGGAQKNQVEVLKNSGLLSEFVRSTGGNWEQSDIESLVAKLREENITVTPEEIGTLLEAEKVACAQKVTDKKTEEEVTVNFDKLSLRKKREFLGIEIKKRIR